MSDEYARTDGSVQGGGEQETGDLLRPAPHRRPMGWAPPHEATPTWRLSGEHRTDLTVPASFVPDNSPAANETHRAFASEVAAHEMSEQPGSPTAPQQGEPIYHNEPSRGEAPPAYPDPRIAPPTGGGGSSGRHSGPPSGGGGSKPSSHWKRWLIIILAILVLLGAGAVTVWRTGVLSLLTPAPSPTPFVPPAAPQTETPEPTAQTDTPTWPLTGIASPEIAERPALVIKVENSVDARPQQGLESADIVYEELVEGGIPRYVAIFHSTLPDQVLPIRSIRPMDGPIASWTKGLMVFSGGQTAFSDRAKKDGMQLISMDYGADGFSRVKGRVGPHNVVGNIQEFLAQADASHQASPPAFAAFATQGQLSTAQAVGGFATHVEATLGASSHPRWSWDVATQSWLRSEGDKPAMVVAGTQLSAKNLLLLSVQVRATGGVDVHGTGIPETIVVASGDGVVLSSQMSAPITWKKDAETDVMQFFDAGGNPLVLAPGNTWIELVPTTGSYAVS